MTVIWKSSPLLRKLTWVVVIKLVLIFAIWWLLMRDQYIKVKPDTAALHLLSPVSSAVTKE